MKLLLDVNSDQCVGIFLSLLRIFVMRRPRLAEVLEETPGFRVLPYLIAIHLHRALLEVLTSMLCLKGLRTC